MNIIVDLKTWRFWRHFLLKVFACGGVISAIIQSLIIFFPSVSFFFEGIEPFFIIMGISIMFGLCTSWPHPIEMEYSTPKTKIKIIRGNILEQTEHLVVGVCDTFDTKTPNIISRNSLLGQTLDKLYDGDIKKLDVLLEKELQQFTPVGSISKDGKQTKFEIGTVAVVRHEPRNVYFLAYCEMNEKNEASASVDFIWKSLFNLWEAQSAYGNHKAIAITALGGGLARISNILPTQDSIRLIALSFMFASRKKKISDELRIVVQPEDYDRLDRLELQSFLSSLKPS